jgi:hypothetical protein
MGLQPGERICAGHERSSDSVPRLLQIILKSHSNQGLVFEQQDRIARCRR